MIIYTNLFTIKGSSPEQNRYIDLFWIWLKYIQKYGDLKSDDKIFVMSDSVTADYLEKTDKTFILDFSILEYRQPETYVEGILRRYTFPFYNEVQKDTQVLYFDVDILCVGPLEKIGQVKKDELLVFPENRLLDDYYLGALLTEKDKEFFYEKSIENLTGFTGGVFAFYGDAVHTFFLDLVREVKEGRKDLAMHEQPYYCKLIVECLFGGKIPQLKIKIASRNLMKHNISTHSEFMGLNKNDVLFLNFCGEPGNSIHHWNKIFQFVLSEL